VLQQLRRLVPGGDAIAEVDRVPPEDVFHGE
jgi:hypothetical protein